MQTSRTASKSARPAAESAAATRTPEAPVATSAQESLVDVSPSIVMALKDGATACARQRSSRSFGTAASVATNASIVAMSGQIMPAPLAIPVTRIVSPSTATSREASLRTVSVVMIASAARGHPSSARSASSAGSAAPMRSTGSGSPMTPVENGSTSSRLQPAAAANRRQDSCAASSPASPVPAFAFPELIRR